MGSGSGGASVYELLAHRQARVCRCRRAHTNTRTGAHTLVSMCSVDCHSRNSVLIGWQTAVLTASKQTRHGPDCEQAN